MEEQTNIDLMSYFFNIQTGDWTALLWILLITVIGIALIPITISIKKLVVTLIDTKTREIEDRIRETHNKNDNSGPSSNVYEDTLKFRLQLAEQMLEITNLIKELKQDIAMQNGHGVFHHEVDVIRTVHKHFDAVNNKLYCFFLERLHENHIDTQADDISTNYSQYANDLAGRMHSYLKHWEYKNKSLGDFTSSGGSLRYCVYIATEMFAIQMNAYEDNKKVNIKQVSNGLARCTSHLLSQFKIYLETGESFMEQWDDTKPVYKLISKLNDIEEL